MSKSKSNINIQAGSLSDRFVLRRMVFKIMSGQRTRKQISDASAKHHGVANNKRLKGTLNVFATVEWENTKNHANNCRNHFNITHPCWGESWKLIPKTSLDIQWKWEDKVKTDNMNLYRLAIESVKDQKERDRIELSEGGEASLYDPNAYPTEKKMLETYSLHFESSPVPDPSMDVRSGSSTQQVERFRNELIESHNRNAKEAHDTMLKRIIEESFHVKDRCDVYNGGRKGSFNDTLIPRLTSIVAAVKANNIYENPELDDICNTVLSDFANIDTKDLREDKELRKEASAKAGKIISSLNKLKTSKY